jgi:Predicted Co/Zn/Cd cation transporters
VRKSTVNPTWYAFVVLAVVIAIDLSRTLVSWRTARQYGSAALASNAVHFGSDLVGSVAVLVGLLLAPPAIRTVTRWRRCSSARSCCSPPRG